MPYLWYSGKVQTETLQGDELRRWADAYAQESEDAEKDLWALFLAACRGLKGVDPRCCAECERYRGRAHRAAESLLPALRGRFRDNAAVALRLLDGEYTEAERVAFLEDVERLAGEVVGK